MDHFIHIYQQLASPYQQMISYEDVDGNLLKAIHEITPLWGKKVLDVGSGTGRLPILLADQGVKMTASDLHSAMLLEQAQWQTTHELRWPLVRSDIAHQPHPDQTFDVVFAGWALGHTCGWHPDDFLQRINAMLTELERLLQPGGHILIFETMGTGVLTPMPPTLAHAAFYAHMVNQRGYHERVLQTDYLFNSVDEAVAQTRFFFGDDLAEKIRLNNWQRLPEFTGVWHKQK